MLNTLIKKMFSLPKPYYHFIGFSLFFGSILSEFFIFDSKIDSPFIITFFLSINWFFYPLISEKFLSQKNFSFLFSNVLFLTFVLPILIIKIVTDTAGIPSPQLFRDEIVFYFLGMPLSNFLGFFGYNTLATGDTIYFENLETGIFTPVSISTGCSGLYSTLIFINALVCYIALSEKSNFKSIIILSVLGILISYVANLFRMSIIIVIGHYYGMDALFFTHANIGWIIFSSWVFIFWLFLDFFYLRSEKYI